MINYIGIDPGLSGGIVVIDDAGKMVSKWIMPVYPEAKGKNTLDLNELNSIFECIKKIAQKDGKTVSCYLEKVHAMPGQGVSSMFKMGRGFGSIEAMLAAHKIPYKLVLPLRWSKVMHKDISKELKPKQRSLMVLKRSYPTLDLRPTERSKNPHEGLMDALLIAEYGRLSEK